MPKLSVRKEIRKAVEWCKESGIGIVNKEWGVTFGREQKYFIADDDENGVCALGALLIYKNGNIAFAEYGFDVEDDLEGTGDDKADKVAAKVLGVDDDWVTCFVHGFDNENLISIGEKVGWDADRKQFMHTSDGDILENRKAYKMGQDFRKEFIEDDDDEEED